MKYTKYSTREPEIRVFNTSLPASVPEYRARVTKTPNVDLADRCQRFDANGSES